MTSYHGGKQRIGKKISDIIVDESINISDDEGWKIKGYCEPFCGMLGVYRHVTNLYNEEYKYKLKYKAGDTNKSVIMMWEKAQKGWEPPTHISEKEYNRLKNLKDSAKRGYVGHQYSFGGKFFKGYAPKYGKTVNSTAASKRIVNISKDITDVNFKVGLYQQYSNLKNYVIYCDPPYNETETHYNNTFNEEEFFNWCRKMSKNNIVFVSEYKVPKDFQLLWSSKSKLTGVSKSEGTHKSKVRTEKLYIV